ncbi:MAG: hypothetical protein COA36_10445 [Desulfotalea sp.]|nr:MAG: hypothetical protein COA36_10445 [Desulfotalea sp.]
MQKQNSTVVHKRFKNNHLIEIRDTPTQRSLYFDHHLQSAMVFEQPQELILSYTRYMLLGLLINQQPKNILIIGLGSGSFIRFFQHFCPHSHIDGIESSQHVIDIARGYFFLPETEKIHITCADGNAFVSQSHTGKKYDLILVDAFDAEGMAPTIYKKSFFISARRLLSEEGSISFNLWSADRKVFKDIKTTLARTFHSCLLLPVPNRGNIIAVAMSRKIPWDKINPAPKDLEIISNRLQLDFKQLVRVTKRHNGTLSMMLKSLFR